MSKLYVNEIHPKTAGGAVLMPAKPAFMAGQTNLTSNTPNAVIPFSAIILDQGNNFSLSNNRFDVPVTGVYHFHFHSFLDAQNTSNGGVSLRINGANSWPGVGNIRTYTNDLAGSGVFGPPISIQATVACSSGDYVDLFTDIGLHNNNGCYFGGYLVG